MRAYDVFVSGQKFTIFSPNAREIVVDHLLFRFLISRSVTEIFAVKVWSCLKWPSQIFGLLAPEICTDVVSGSSSMEYLEDGLVASAVACYMFACVFNCMYRVHQKWHNFCARYNFTRYQPIFQYFALTESGDNF